MIIWLFLGVAVTMWPIACAFTDINGPRIGPMSWRGVIAFTPLIVWIVISLATGFMATGFTELQ